MNYDAGYTQGKVKNLVNEMGRKYSLNTELIAGIIHVESKGIINAARYEPIFFNKYIKEKKLEFYVPLSCSEATERVFRATSWGLMQIMGSCAREAGFKGEFLNDLCDPEINLDLGCHLFKKLLDKTDDTILALFAYNAGAAAEYPGPKPNDYPGKVMAAIDSHHLGYLL